MRLHGVLSRSNVFANNREVKNVSRIVSQVPNLEEEARKLAGKDGEIKWGEFYRFAMPTDLFKSDFQDRVFHKVSFVIFIVSSLTLCLRNGFHLARSIWRTKKRKRNPS